MPILTAQKRAFKISELAILDRAVAQECLRNLKSMYKLHQIIACHIIGEIPNNSFFKIFSDFKKSCVIKILVDFKSLRLSPSRCVMEPRNGTKCFLHELGIDCQRMINIFFC